MLGGGALLLLLSRFVKFMEEIFWTHLLLVTAIYFPSDSAGEKSEQFIMTGHHLGKLG